MQWKALNTASVYKANRLFEQFRLKKRSYLFPLINSSLIRAGTPFWLKRSKSEQCPPQQLLCNILWQKYCKHTVTFLFPMLCTVLTTRIKYSTLMLMCVGENLVWMTPYFYCKKLSSDKSNRLLEQILLFPRCSVQRFPL